MKFAPRSLRIRIALFFIGLLAGVQFLTQLTVNDANSRIASTHVADELDHGERVLRRLLADRGARLQQDVRVLVSDFAFRKTVGAGDPATTQSVLDNHGARVHADAGIVLSDTRQIVASFGLPTTLSPQTIAQLKQTIEKKEDHSWIMPIGGKLMQFAVAPILSPDPVGWAAFGFVIDENVSGDLKQLTGLEISFLTQETGKPYEIAASSLTAAQRSDLLRAIVAQPRVPKQLPEIDISGQRHASSAIILDEAAQYHSAVLVQKSVEESVAPFKKISNILTIVSIVGALGGALSGVWVSRAITNPIEVLTEATNRIRQGERSVAVPSHLTGEIGQLAKGFQKMSDEIDKREAEISRLAFIDPLTQLANRTGILRAASQALVSRTDTMCVAIAALDIARLQHINDGLGYSVGDSVILAVAQRLAAAARPEERVGRTEGDGFAWLIYERNAEAVESRLRSFMESFAADAITVEGQTIDVQLHVGWAVSRNEQDDSNALFRCAEIACDVANAKQVSPVRYDASMSVESAPMLGLLSELRRALAQDEFILVYQPKLTLDGCPASVEALVRWNHPQKGMLGPNTFIEFAERTGNVRGITRNVVLQALKQSRRWIEAGLEIAIAINISARDLQDDSFPAFVRAAIEQENSAPELLKFEITERALLDNFAAAERALEQFKRMGIAVSLDDYGTGYATLTHLSRLAVSELKIDRSFVSNLSPDSRNFAIVRTTVELGHQLGMRVVAEGVETTEEWNAIRKTNCDEVQGYLFAKPMPASALPEWWQTRHATYTTIQRAAALPAAASKDEKKV
jgi:diguanylate cyclase